MKIPQYADALPPWVDVVGPDSEKCWISPALPCLPVRELQDDGRFEAIALTALALKRGARCTPYIEFRVERTGMTLGPDGTAMPDRNDGHGLHQVLAYGSVRLDRLVKVALPPLGRSVTAYVLTFYENGFDMRADTVAGGYLYEPQIVVEVHRGYDRPTRPAERSCTCGNIRFLFNEGGKAFKKFVRRLRGIYASAPATAPGRAAEAEENTTENRLSARGGDYNKENKC